MFPYELSRRAPILAVVALFVLVAGCAGPRLPLTYPETFRGPQVDAYHGTRVADPYRWLEELDSERTAAWVEAQNAVSLPFLVSLPRRAALVKRFTELWTYERFAVPMRRGGRYFYRYNDGTLDHSRLFVAAALDAEPRVLIDPNAISADHTASMSWYHPSPDGKRVAYAISESGSDWRYWRIRDVDGGEDLPEVIRQTKFTRVSWSPDSAGFYYSRYPLDADGEADDSKQTSVYYHQVDTAQEADRHVFSVTNHAERIPTSRVTEDGRFLVIDIRRGYTANDVYVQRLLPEKGEVVELLNRWDALYDYVGSQGDTLFFKTTLNAPMGRVVGIDIGSPAPASWREVVPEAREALQSASYVDGRVVASYLRDAVSAVRIYAADTGALEREAELPGLGTAEGFEGSDDNPETFFAFGSFTVPGAIYRFDVATGERALFRESSVPADLSVYETRQVFYTSKDGTRVPMFLVHRKGLEPTGDHPTVLYGYGGFDVSLTPSYRSRWTAWLEMGGVVAMPNLRGGGEYGEPWHLAGTKLEKQNVFDDFHAAARWLIDNGITRTGRLASLGFSNGGLLVGATETQEPTLYGAAIPGVGVLDMLRYHTPSANARAWSSDYGLSEDPDEFRAQHAYSPVHNTQPGTCYPPTLIMTADHDDRVSPWHSYKFGAALQHAQSCDHPILLRVETRAGHGAGKPIWMKVEEEADRWAFLAFVLGMDPS